MILALEHTAAALQLKEPLDPSQHEHIPRVGVKDPEVVVRVAHPPGPPTALLEHLCGRQRPEAEGCVHKSDLELVVAFTAEFRFQGRLEWPQLHDIEIYLAFSGREDLSHLPNEWPELPARSPSCTRVHQLPLGPPQVHTRGVRCGVDRLKLRDEALNPLLRLCREVQAIFVARGFHDPLLELPAPPGCGTGPELGPGPALPPGASSRERRAAGGEGSPRGVEGGGAIQTQGPCVGSSGKWHHLAGVGVMNVGHCQLVTVEDELHLSGEDITGWGTPSTFNFFPYQSGKKLCAPSPLWPWRPSSGLLPPSMAAARAP
mmetsp:Transcript_24671/g.77896  ORF Transcript_24671/g.77896 Transcript_24671/m.77896 type:complete len:317 (+) Transcript_24671:275-1225(+)